MKILRWSGLVGGAALLCSIPLAAQSFGLEQVEELSRLGRAEEARTVLLEWWNGDRDDSSRRDLQRGLWLRGRLTVDPVQADLDFQRLAVLYPNGPFTPQAMFRLAQSAYAQGDADSARRHVTTLARDYPTSPSRAAAESWLASAGPVPPPSDVAPVRAPSADIEVTSGPDPDAAPPAEPPADPTDVEPTEAAPAEPEPVLDWMVQFGAFAESPRAMALHEELMDAGLDARLVRVEGSGFLHVRIGRFTNRIDANTQLEEVTAQGFTAAIVRDARAEEVVDR